MITLNFKFEVLPQVFNEEEKLGWRIHIRSAICNGQDAGEISYPILPSEIKKYGLEVVLEDLFPGTIFYELKKEIHKIIQPQ